MIAKQIHHLGSLVLPEETIIDKDAFQMVADHLVKKEGHHTRVDPSAQSADDFA